MTTVGEWRTEAVSDAVRVVVGSGRQKIILARLNPKQLPESETHDNARLMASSPHLLRAAMAANHLCRSLLAVRDGASDELIRAVAASLDAAIAKAGGA